ncbi:uncharacterized protein LOC123006125 [Tribolium madens]|uniref:uncharacterized protein LOC123006125 n=1 Tax=Tribolium madens TaxID=41895 RepID=UPI001CF73336|nr:uncharacterized protein LOC123006125 [Tribolium madens]
MTLPDKFLVALSELRQIQKRRLKNKMEAREIIADGKIIARTENAVQEYKGTVVIENNFLFHENSNNVKSGIIHQSQVTVCYVKNVTIEFELNDGSVYNNYSLQLNSIDEVNKVLTKMKPLPLSRPNTYPNDGNVTSSDTDSDDSGAEKTTGVNNSFDSDTPSVNNDE